jgi:hypothetical protein
MSQQRPWLVLYRLRVQYRRFALPVATSLQYEIDESAHTVYSTTREPVRVSK